MSLKKNEKLSFEVFFVCITPQAVKSVSRNFAQRMPGTEAFTSAICEGRNSTQQMAGEMFSLRVVTCIVSRIGAAQSSLLRWHGCLSHRLCTCRELPQTQTKPSTPSPDLNTLHSKPCAVSLCRYGLQSSCIVDYSYPGAGFYGPIGRGWAWLKGRQWRKKDGGGRGERTRSSRRRRSKKKRSSSRSCSESSCSSCRWSSKTFPDCC